jgi:CO/xanthine dehydrogenase FAD-binding subunit
MGTIGGNLCQHVRCWYYRSPNNRFNCVRKGGTTCFAASGDNRYHTIFGAPLGCNAVYPSDTATALMALNASIVTNKRTIGIENFFDPLAGTVLGSGELVTEVDVPTPPAGSTQTFTKFRLRKAIDFPILNVSTMVTTSGSTVSAARIAFGGVYPTPLRSTAAESAIVGQPLNATTAAAAAAAAVQLATPLQYNVYKVPVLKTLLTRALMPPTPVTIPLPTPITLGTIKFSSPPNGGTLTGTQSYTISGTISPTPSLPDSVHIEVQLQGGGAPGMPGSTVADSSTVAVTASGTFSYATKVGGSSAWVPGAYIIMATDSKGASGNMLYEYSTS